MRRGIPRPWGSGARAPLPSLCAVLFAIALVPMGASAAEPYPSLNAKVVPLAENIGVGDTIGKIRFLGMLEIPTLTVDGMRLSQLSDLAWDDSAQVLYALSDKGFLVSFHPVFHEGALVDLKLARVVPLRELKTNQPLQRRRADAEGMDIRRNGQTQEMELIISFERFPRIVRYRTDGYAIEEYKLPPPLNDAKNYRDGNKMLEGMCFDARYGVLAMPEAPLPDEDSGYNRLFSLTGRSWRYPTENENRVVGLACLGNGEVLVLERDFGRLFWRSAVAIKRVRLSNAPADTTLAVETLVSLDTGKGFQIDNFEGIAHHQGKRFFLISDNNDFFLQRTLLLYFELLE